MTTSNANTTSVTTEMQYRVNMGSGKLDIKFAEAAGVNVFSVFMCERTGLRCSTPSQLSGAEKSRDVSCQKCTQSNF